MPEGFYPLAHATLFLATAPKSNSVGSAYGAAMADVRETRNDPVPLHLRNAPTGLMRDWLRTRLSYAHADYAGWNTRTISRRPSACRRIYPRTWRKALLRARRSGAEARIVEWIRKRRSG